MLKAMNFSIMPSKQYYVSVINSEFLLLFLIKPFMANTYPHYVQL